MRLLIALASFLLARKKDAHDDEEESAKPSAKYASGIYYAATREAEEQG
jgi:hypothetical protein